MEKPFEHCLSNSFLDQMKLLCRYRPDNVEWVRQLEKGGVCLYTLSLSLRDLVVVPKFFFNFKSNKALRNN